MRTRQLFKTSLLSLTALCSIALAIVSCANEDIAQNNTGSDNNKNFTTFVAGEPTKTRTSMDYNSGKFYWEEGDKIYVKDDDGTLQESNAVDAAHAHSESFSFMVPGKFNNSATYKVYYLGKNGSGNQVTIPAAQAQTEPNSTKHLGELGDYGSAIASGTVGGGSFRFQLEHQATILVFQPYTNNDILKNCYLVGVEVSSDDDITETYTIDPITGNLNGSAGGKQILLMTIDPVAGSTNEKGFPLTNTSASIATNGAYMLIKPGIHTLRVRYWVKSYTDNIEGTITRTLSSFDYKKNTYYDMIANLNITDYDGDHYYMWDAQDQYWKGYEWSQNLPIGVGQPTINNNSSPNYAQSNSDSRYYNDYFPGLNMSNPATHTSCKDLPNANEMSWYAMFGDPHWDADELWSTMKHLCKGGIWLKKKSVLQSEGNYSTEKSADGTTDLRITYKDYVNNIMPFDLLSPTNISKYFYLPALGMYNVGTLDYVNMAGLYWTSSATPHLSNFAYSLYFSPGQTSVQGYSRDKGFRAEPLQ